MNKKGYAKLVILGVPVTVILVFLFRLWVANEVYDAVQPELQKAFIQLGDAIVCPPELKNENFEICINKEGDIITTGKVDDVVSLEIDSSGRTNSCIINIGEYLDKKTCRIDDFNLLENFEAHYSYKATTLILNSKNLELYIFNQKNIKIPIKKWNGLWRITRYIPK
jgi:hypothetical protein